MDPDDIKKLLGGYATGTLTPEEQQALFAAALQDQELFDALAREQSLRDLLRDPSARARLLAATAGAPPAPWYRRWWVPVPLVAAAAGALFFANVVVRHNPRPAAQLTIARVEPPPAPQPALEAPPAQSAPQGAPRQRADVVPSVKPPAPAVKPAAAAGTATGGGGRGGRGGGGRLFDGLAEIAGSVKDPSGAAVAGAQVTAREVASGTVRTATTSSDGQFNLPAVPPGKYQVEVSSTGFQAASHELNVNERDRAVLATTLKVGAATETIEVSAAPVVRPPGIGPVRTDQLKVEELKSLPALGRSAQTVQPAVRQAARAVGGISGALVLPALTMQYHVLRRNPDGSFSAIGADGSVAAGTPIKLQVVPGGAGNLRIQESTPEGGWRELVSQQVEQNKPFETQPLEYREPGRKQFRVTLSPGASIVDGVAMQFQAGAAGAAPQNQNQNQTRNQAKSNSVADGLVLQPASAIVTITIK